MSSMVIRFPDGTKEFRYPEKPVQVDDTVWHDGARFRVVSVSSDDGRDVVVVEPVPDGLVDELRSEEGAIRLVDI